VSWPAAPELFAEVGRVVRTGGLFVFHVNALEDRPLRARWLPARELEPEQLRVSRPGLQAGSPTVGDEILD
jgi:hypothetical protein